MEAPSGWGKTRIAQEVYGLLAKRQERKYWPDSILKTYDVDVHDIAGRRKRIYPNSENFEREKGALPTFFWWGLACEMRSSNDVAETIRQDLEQLHIHSDFLEAAWSAQKAVGIEKYATVQAARAVFQEVLDEGTGAILAKGAEMLGANIPGLGLAVSLGRFGVGVAREKREQLQKISTLGALPSNEEKENMIDGIVSLLSRLASPHLPIIIFVEDLHKASNALQELLIKILRRNVPILILSTTWPSEFEAKESFASLINDQFIGDRILRIQYNKPPPKGFPKNASLDELPPKALSEIIYNYYPEADSDTVERLIKRYPNPLPLELVLSLRRQRRQYPRLTLSTEQVDRLPRDVRRLYNDLWDELPESVQCALALVTLAMPEDDPIWLSPLVAQTVEHLDILENTKDITRVLGEDSVPHGWSRVVESWLRRFGEPDQLAIAKEAVSDFYDEEDIENFLEVLSLKIEETDFLNENLNNPEMQYKAWVALGLASQFSKGVECAKLAGLYLLRCFDVNASYESVAICVCEQLDQFYEQRRAIDEPLLEFLYYYQDNLAYWDFLKKSLSICQRLVDASEKFYGKKHEKTLNAKLVFWLRTLEVEGIGAQLSQIEGLYKECDNVLPTGHTLRLEVSMHLAIRYSTRAGKAQEAIKLIKDVINTGEADKNLGTLDLAELYRSKLEIIYNNWHEPFVDAEELNNTYKKLYSYIDILKLEEPDCVFVILKLESFLARYLLSGEKYAEALVVLKKSLIFAQQREDKLAIATVMQSLADVYPWIDRHDKAIHFINKSLIQIKNLVDDLHPISLGMLKNRALLLFAMNDIEEATTDLKSYLDKKLMYLGVDEFNLPKERKQMISLFRDKNLHEGTVPFLTSFLEYIVDRFGKGTPIYFDSKRSLYFEKYTPFTYASKPELSFSAKKELAQACTDFLTLLSEMETGQHVREIHEIYANVLHGLARVYFLGGKYEDALRYMEKSNASYVELYGDGYEDFFLSSDIDDCKNMLKKKNV